MAFRVDCPYCNAATVIAEPLAKAACGRCGESFAPAAYHEQLNEFPASMLGPPVTPRTRVLMFVAGSLMLCAVGGWVLYFFLRTPPAAAPTVMPAVAPTTTPPAALAGLRHLSADSNLIIAIQPAAIVTHAERSGTDVKALLGSFGVPTAVWDNLENAGVAPAMIDHLAACVVVANSSVPKVVAVLKLRQPPDLDAFLRKLRAEKKSRSGPPMYGMTLAGFPVTLLPANETTFLVAVTMTSDDELLKLSQQPRPDFVALKPAMTERLSPASFAWLATDTRPWGDAPLFQGELFRKQGAAVAPLRSASVGLSLEPDPTLKLMLDLADEAAAKRCVEALMKLNLESATAVNDGATVKLLAAATPATMAKLMDALKAMIN